MDFFVAAKRIRNRSSIPRERGRVKDNQIKAWHHFFVRLGGGLGFQPIEYVRSFKGAFVCKIIYLRIACGGRNGIGALVHEMNVCRAGARSVQAKSAEETEAIENLCTVREFGDTPIIDLLVEIK